MAGSGTAHLRPNEDIVLEVRNLVVDYKTKTRQTVRAVSDVSLDLKRGETVGLVGESGCGKSTLAKAIMQLPKQTGGTVLLEGKDLAATSARDLRKVRSKFQMIFQDPISSLNPLRKVRDILAEGLRINGLKDKAAIDAKVRDMLVSVGLDPDVAADRRPHEFSGGQCQRISIARAIIVEPEIIVCDEPVSALDVSVQAQILNLLEDMKERYSLTMLFIAHDLAVVKNVSDRVVVMYLGKICEVAPPDDLFSAPLHPYTRGLIESIPEPDPDAEVSAAILEGDLPSPLDPPSGCHFRTRCPQATDLCAQEAPEIRELRPGAFVACHFPLAAGK
jgi:peptide/nickel transport system ATP-binding protein